MWRSFRSLIKAAKEYPDLNDVVFHALGSFLIRLISFGKIRCDPIQADRKQSVYREKCWRIGEGNKYIISANIAMYSGALGYIIILTILLWSLS